MNQPTNEPKDQPPGEPQRTGAEGRAAGPAGEAESTPDAAAIARKKKWDRITLAIILAMVVIWGGALVFHKQIRANYWAWRLAWQPGEPARTQLIDSLIAVDDAAVGPALRLTRDEKPDVRLAGLDVLIGVMEQRHRARMAKVREEVARGRVSPTSLPEEFRRPIAVEPEVARRFGELLDDPSAEVSARAIDGVMLAPDEQAVGRLMSLATSSKAGRVSITAVRAVCEIVRGDRAGELLREILAKAAGPDARAQTVELLWEFPSRQSAGALADALADDRPVGYPPVSVFFDPKFQALLRSAVAGRGPGDASATTRPASAPAEIEPRTVGDYAARMLAHMTGQSFGLLSNRSPADRAEAIARYRQSAAEYRDD